MSETVILIADDEEYVTTVFHEFFKAVGYKTVLASCGAEAIQKFFNQDIACIICDIHMPDMDGFEVLRQAKQKNGKVPFFMISGKYKIDTTLCQAIGVLDFFAKPFIFSDIVQKVQQALKAAA